MKVLCDYCGKKAELVDSEIVYGKDYGMLWLCYPCGAYVGTHKNSKNHAPLGRLANKELREWKMKAHAAFDPLWKSMCMTRKEAYELVQELLGITNDEAHIGKFDIDRCKSLVEKLEEYKRKI